MGGSNPLGDLRQELGIGRALLARHTGIAPAQVRDAEQGRTPVIPAEILAWAARRGVDAVDLDRRFRVRQAGAQQRQAVTALFDRAFKHQRLRTASRSLRAEPAGTVFRDSVARSRSSLHCRVQGGEERSPGC
ncbi:hypothetical protein [Kitasatospora sp. NPDC085879]|uniref:hypothetical protein n=1 Tax=Kitasatospora sp. NPDC085879 TaxID=3154769 RepID=UPI00342891BB